MNLSDYAGTHYLAIGIIPKVWGTIRKYDCMVACLSADRHDCPKDPLDMVIHQLLDVISKVFVIHSSIQSFMHPCVSFIANFIELSFLQNHGIMKIPTRLNDIVGQVQLNHKLV